MLQVIRVIVICLALLSDAVLVFAELEKPAWWDRVQVDMTRKRSSAIQYFDVYDNFLTPGYDETNPEWGLALKKSIKGYTQLLDWFHDEHDMPVLVQAQLQIGFAYQKLEDLPRAREAFEKCLPYKSHQNEDPPRQKGDMEIQLAVEEARRQLEEPGT